MKKTHPLTDKKYFVPFLFVTSLFFLWGFARAILDVLNKHFQDVLNISITQSAYIQVMTYLGYFITALPAGIYINKYGYRKGVVTGLMMYATGAFLFVPGMRMGSFSVFLIALFVIGCGLTFLEVSANPYVTLLGPRPTGSSRLNMAQSFNGLGCVLAPLIVGQFLFATDDADVSIPYVVMGVFVVIAAIVFSFVSLPEIISSAPEKAPESGAKVTIMTILRKETMLYGFLALLAYEVSEICINSYFINFTTSLNWLSDVGASKILSFALILFMAGRFAGSWIMRYVPAERILMICASGCIVCMLAVLLNNRHVSLGALVLNYAFEAVMFPTIYSLALRNLSMAEIKCAGSILMMTPVGGCAFLLMGVIADTASFVIPFVLPLAGFVIVLTYALWLLHRCRGKDRSVPV